MGGYHDLIEQKNDALVPRIFFAFLNPKFKIPSTDNKTIHRIVPCPDTVVTSGNIHTSMESQKKAPKAFVKKIIHFQIQKSLQNLPVISPPITTIFFSPILLVVRCCCRASRFASSLFYSAPLSLGVVIIYYF